MSRAVPAVSKESLEQRLDFRDNFGLVLLGRSYLPFQTSLPEG